MVALERMGELPIKNAPPNRAAHERLNVSYYTSSAVSSHPEG